MRRTATLAAAAMAMSSLAFTATIVTDHDVEPTPPGEIEIPTGQAVIGVIDTGINPYHEVFRDDSELAFVHPSKYIDGYPEDAVALELTFDAEDHRAALNADCELWRSVEKGKLYWFPGTKIIGGVSFQNANVSCDGGELAGETHILDNGGHGTMTASRAAAGDSVDWGACPSCRIVAIEYTGSVNLINPSSSDIGPRDSIKWAADNAHWIDVQSNSWGPIVPVYDPTGAGGLLGSNPEFIREVEQVSAAMPAFWASGNGAAFRGGALGHPSFLNPSATPSAIQVGGHDSGYVTVWPGFPPHLVSDACDSWAAQENSYTDTGDSVGGGTSGATPFVAGNATELLAIARELLGDTETGQREGGVMAAGDPGDITSGPLADGQLTREEWLRIVYTTASPRPERQFEDGPPCGLGGAPYNELPLLWTDVPEGFPEYLNIGYGAVDAAAMELAEQVLLGTADLPDRSTTDTYFEVHHTVGGVTHTVYTTP